MLEGTCLRCSASGTVLIDQATKKLGFKKRRAFDAVLGILLSIAVHSLFGILRSVWTEERYAAYVARLHHRGPVANVDELKGTGRIYLVQMGPHTAPYSLDDFASWLRSKYGMEVAVLPPTRLDASSFDSSRRQFVAELLNTQLKRDYPALAADPNAYLIGFTDADMYSVQYRWNSTFTLRDRPRTAVITSSRMGDYWFERIREDRSTANQKLQTRLRRILLKDLAILYWRLQVNNDPTSLLHDTLEPDLPTGEIYESDLDPERSPWGTVGVQPLCFLHLFGKGRPKGAARGSDPQLFRHERWGRIARDV